MIRYVNLDATDAFAGLLQAGEPPALADLLGGDRIRDFELPGGGGLAFNYAARPIDDKRLELLTELAAEQQLSEKFQALAGGEVMNPGEGRMVLHHLCRGQLGAEVIVDGRNLRTFYQEQQNRIAEFAEAVHLGRITTPAGARFEQVCQVGIGGSDLGPRALYLALEGYAREEGLGPKLPAAFISNVDPDDANDVLRRLSPEKTLFILVSKSGTTQETLTNEALVLSVLESAGVSESDARKHIICVTSETSPLAKSEAYLESFFIDDYIGGRYSSTSAVGGAVLSLAYGSAVFEDLLAGAHEADQLAYTSPAQGNAAMLDALIGVYERNVLGFPTTAVLPYSQALHRFPAHLQQLDMESNGKSVNRDGEDLAYATGPIVFGEPGTNGQHSFYQLLHQGTDPVPLQFVGFHESQGSLDLDFEGSSSQTKLNANLAAQIVAFAIGKDDENPNKGFPGNRPSSLIYGRRLTARPLGALLSHFENKVMFQGFLWNINSFDQEGVQLGKVLTKKVLSGEELNPVLGEYVKILLGSERP
jgi:glucose-6-phosphate isomerase